MLFLALFASGASGLVNQVAWQRALKLYLGGSETISALIVVLVFMVGLGVGSLHMGMRMHRVRNIVRVFALCEVGLCLANLAIAWLASLDLTESVYGFQRAAVSLGVPLRLIYAVSAVCILAIPCYLMGLTMPLASEIAQRDLGSKKSSTVDVLFGVNTLGAVTGALVTGLWLLPVFGQIFAMLLAAGCNLAAGALLVVFVAHRTARAPAIETQPAVDAAPVRGFLRTRPRFEEWVGFALGFLSLAYEMLLYRIVPLAHEPLPYTFSVVLCGFLGFWSLGIFLATRIRERIPLFLFVAAIGIAFVPALLRFDRAPDGPSLVLAVAIYSLPCIFFGLLFGQVVARHVKSWGIDVGRYYAMNTVGSALGILLMTLLGYELHHDFAAWWIAAGFVVVLAWFVSVERSRAGKPRMAWAASGVVVVAGLVVLSLRGSVEPLERDGRITYSGRDGVVEIVGRNMILDGLWHSELSDGQSHLYKANWQLAAFPYLCHPDDEIEDVCVVGLGSGLTVATLAGIDGVQSIDAYEINHTIRRVLVDYPEGTLGVADDPKVEIRWQDGRSGLALDTKKYDIIIQQPLYLKQAGSSILLSVEYIELLASRLKERGIVCLYSNSMGNAEQALLVRTTARRVFPHYVSFDKGYMLVLSKSPFEYSEETLRRKFAGEGPFFEACRKVHPSLWLNWIDRPTLDWDSTDLVITDDHPIVEYPDIVKRLIDASRR